MWRIFFEMVLKISNLRHIFFIFWTPEKTRNPVNNTRTRPEPEEVTPEPDPIPRQWHPNPTQTRLLTPECITTNTETDKGFFVSAKPIYRPIMIPIIYRLYTTWVQPHFYCTIFIFIGRFLRKMCAILVQVTFAKLNQEDTFVGMNVLETVKKIHTVIFGVMTLRLILASFVTRLRNNLMIPLLCQERKIV